MAHKHSADYPTSVVSAAVPSPVIVDTHPEHSDLPEHSAATYSDSKKCYNCGHDRHPKWKCPAKNSICSKCSKPGHWGQVCRSSGNQQRNDINRNYDFNRAKKTSAAASLKSLPYLATTDITDKVLSKCTLRGKEHDTFVDTGSSGNFIKKSVCLKLDIMILPSPGDVMMADKTIATAFGECVVDLWFNGKLYTGVVLTVMDDVCTDIILGRKWMKRHKSVKFTFDGKEPELNVAVCGLNASTSTPPSQAPLPAALSSSNTMNISPISLFEHLTPDCKPIAIKSKRQSDHNAKFIREEVQKLLKQGKIRPSKSPWRAQVLVVPGTDTHRRRMVIDYSRTVNRFTQLDAYPLPHIEDMVRKISEYSYFSTYDLKSAYHQVPIVEEDMAYTAFEADGSLWEFTVVPFGVTNGVPSFQRVMDKVVLDENLDDTFPFLDNITVCGHTSDELKTNDEQFQHAVDKYGINLNDFKTAANQTTIPLMGYIVSYGEF